MDNIEVKLKKKRAHPCVIIYKIMDSNFGKKQV
jgi:hypothetical protein